MVPCHAFLSPSQWCLQVLLFQKKQDEMQSRFNAVEKQLQEVRAHGRAAC